MKNIAVIGSGISGLTAAHILSRRHQVTVFEKDSRLGGHTATHDVHYNGERHAIDTGFIVFNDRTYPNFIKLMDQLQVTSRETSMGFSVTAGGGDFEFSGNSLNSLFGQRRNIFSLSFWNMLRQIIKFNRSAQTDLNDGKIAAGMTLGEYLDAKGYSDSFRNHYLIPMGAAIWSASFVQMLQFPLTFFVEFFSNHGLLTVFDQPQWRVIEGGSRAYIAPMIEPFKERIHLNASIVHIRRSESCVELMMNDGTIESFDEVVIATHSDQALALLNDASKQELGILGDITYQANSVVLHTDKTLLPRRQRVWSSWNYLLATDHTQLPTLTYNMNILQGLESQHTFCVTLNADAQIDPKKIIDRFSYAHPQFSLSAQAAQRRWSEINGVNRTWYCGAYWANGFHEDGVTSALRVASAFGLGL